MFIIFLGPPGSGKGTQAKKLISQINMPHIALGDILREEVANKSSIGLQVESYLSKGALVPDELVIEITRQRIQKEDCQKGLILDGFPRTVNQGIALDSMVKELGKKVDKVIYFHVELQSLIDRLVNRLTCKNCGAVYNTKFNPPKKDNLCDKNCGELYKRSDDNEQVIKNRNDNYLKQTSPLIDYYKKQNILIEINASKSEQEVYDDLLKVL